MSEKKSWSQPDADLVLISQIASGERELTPEIECEIRRNTENVHQLMQVYLVAKRI